MVFVLGEFSSFDLVRRAFPGTSVYILGLLSPFLRSSFVSISSYVEQSLCRLVITVVGCIIKIMLIPFKYIMGGARPAGGHCKFDFSYLVCLWSPSRNPNAMICFAFNFQTWLPLITETHMVVVTWN